MLAIAVANIECADDFFCEKSIPTKKRNQQKTTWVLRTNNSSLRESYRSNPPSTKQIKTKIGVGSVVKAKVGEMEENTRKGIPRRMDKEVA